MIAKIVILTICGIIAIIAIISKVNSKKLIKAFKSGNVMVSGLRGRGKDMIFCYVINKRKENYISNVEYSNPNKKYKRFEFSKKVWDLGGNSYKQIMSGNIKPYNYPYPDGIDYYISDAGVYFPAQSHKELDKENSGVPVFMALSRHLGDCNIHANAQRQNRVWDKIREQSDIYIVMTGTKVIFKKILFMKWTEYAHEESAEKQIKKPHFGIGKRAREAKASYEASHGEIKKRWLIGILPYNYDSRRFKKIIENGGQDYERQQDIREARQA